MHECATGRELWADTDDDREVIEALKGNGPIPVACNCSMQVQDLLKGILVRDPEERPSADAIVRMAGEVLAALSGGD